MEVAVVARRRKRTLQDLERQGPMRASSKLPTEERPTKYVSVGLQAAREVAGMTVEEVASACGYNPGVIAQMERGIPFHTGSISRAASVIPNHDLRLIRAEGG